jgi:hypothetical protein
MGMRCTDHVTPLYPQTLALTSPTSGGCSVGIVCSRTQATEFVLFEVGACVVYNQHETTSTVPYTRTSLMA